jgi:hypothetical protein
MPLADRESVGAGASRFMVSADFAAEDLVRLMRIRSNWRQTRCVR